jgi:RNA polymerase sigma-70 factor (ECF subfamily)
MVSNTVISEINRMGAEDRSTIGRFQSGDGTAFDDLMRRHCQRANTFARQLTKDRDEAADVVADAFIRAFRSLDRFRGESSFSSWLYRIVLNCFLDRRKKAHIQVTVRFDELSGGQNGLGAMPLADRGESAHELLVRRERISAIEAAMKRLPPNQRRAFMMYQADAMSYEDIASELAIPIGTVKSRLNRARLHIRRTIRLQRARIDD